MILLVVITGNFVDATKCGDCEKGCMMSSFDGCNTCIQQVFCSYGKWTTDNHKYCTYDDECFVEIDNPLEYNYKIPDLNVNKNSLPSSNNLPYEYREE
jgi:hypothetical protein